MRSLIRVAILCWGIASSSAWGQISLHSLGSRGPIETGARVALGRVLLSEFQCARCHEPSNAHTGQLDVSFFKDLRESVPRLRSEFLRSFLADVHSANESSRMPDLLVGYSTEARLQTAVALQAFLLDEVSFATDPKVMPLVGDAIRGQELFFLSLIHI